MKKIVYLLLCLLIITSCTTGQETGSLTPVTPTSVTPTLSPTPTTTPIPTPTSTTLPTSTPTPTPTSLIVIVGATPTAGTMSVCANLALEIDFQQTQSMLAGGIPIENLIKIAGEVPLFVDTTKKPPYVYGKADIPVSGGGRVGNCVFENSGTVTYQFEGEIRTGPDGDLQLYLHGQQSAIVVMRSPATCGGGSTTPAEDIGEQVLRYEEGAKVEWNWDVPMGGIRGESAWILHLLCDE
ncbi:MAG: hypothetical protein WHS83_17380 [Chloroflexus sp.]|uniref:hypothetical protein n=1 Tax=Chloroflexus sp. TaxID=1904827 RepID=UPI0030A0DD10